MISIDDPLWTDGHWTFLDCTRVWNVFFALERSSRDNNECLIKSSESEKPLGSVLYRGAAKKIVRRSLPLHFQLHITVAKPTGNVLTLFQLRQKQRARAKRQSSDWTFFSIISLAKTNGTECVIFVACHRASSSSTEISLRSLAFLGLPNLGRRRTGKSAKASVSFLHSGTPLPQRSVELMLFRAWI